MTGAFYDLSLVKKVRIIQVHFTLKCEDLGVQLNYHGWKQWFMVCQHLHLVTHLQDVGMTRITTFHVNGMAFG